jgi:hypothetical protein
MRFLPNLRREGIKGVGKIFGEGSDFIAVLLTSVAEKLEGGSAFIPPHFHVCISTATFLSF